MFGYPEIQRVAPLSEARQQDPFSRPGLLQCPDEQDQRMGRAGFPADFVEVVLDFFRRGP